MGTEIREEVEKFGEEIFSFAMGQGLYANYLTLHENWELCPRILSTKIAR
jgi:hypothetical protein